MGPPPSYGGPPPGADGQPPLGWHGPSGPAGFQGGGGMQPPPAMLPGGPGAPYPPYPPQYTPPSQPSPSPAPPRAAWAAANLDPDDDYVVGPPAEIPDCLARLSSLGVKAHATQQPVHAEGKQTCGAPQVVVYDSGPTGVRWSSAPTVTCLVALGLARFETIVQEEAQRAFSSRVKRIDHVGTYSCRPMVRFNLASEHSFVNAIDIRGVELENGTRITVDPGWGPMTEPPATASARFLRQTARRTYDEGAFSVVLGPPWDALHKDHLHLDQARYRVDGLIVKR